jgi:hypothetical protein
MSTQFLVAQISAGPGTVAIGAVAQHAGLRIPVIVAALMLTIAWFVVMRRRRQISDAFSAAGAPVA